MKSTAMQNIIEIDNGTTRIPDFRLPQRVTVAIPAGEPLAIVGGNACGKTKLVDMMTGAHPLLGSEVKYDFSPSASTKVSENIKTVTFRDAYGNIGDECYQLRWNHGLIEDGNETVADILAKHATDDGFDEIISTLGIHDLLEKETLMLSSGELRRVQLAEMLSASPRLMIVDNPYIGLDVNARRQVSEFLAKISARGKTQLILVVSRLKDIPFFIEKILPVADGKVLPIMNKADYIRLNPVTENSLDARRRDMILSLPDCSEGKGQIVNCNNISIRYGNRTIFHNFSWTVESGERWALNGENGAGKSTLLSLVCADNPQAYACDISLFGHKRGSGESIWDIKKNIGYVSPEMFRSYRRNMTALKIAASGMSDTSGVYNREVPADIKQRVLFWFDIFGISNLAERNYLQLSSGEQRMVLLARAFVKDPALLVLDEPFHGLDSQRRETARSIIDTFCSRPGKTLIMVTHYEEEYPSCINRRLTLKKITSNI